MFKFIVFLVVLAVGGYFFPQVYESTSNACTAIEGKAIRALSEADPAAGAAVQVAAQFSNGQLGRAAAEQEYPSLPGGLACVVGYYTMKPDELRF